MNRSDDRRRILRMLAAFPLAIGLFRPRRARAQAPGTSPVRVDTKGLAARIKFESVVAGYLTEINGKYKLRITELTLEPGGHVGEHNHAGPGIRLMTLGEMTYVLPNETHINKTDKPNQHLLFEILPAELKGPSLMPARK
jgi:hypothetical protein